MKKGMFVVFLFMVFSCKEKHSNADEVKNIFETNIKSLITEVNTLEKMVQTDGFENQIQDQFFKAHKAYKKIETLSEYYFPEVSKALNGPALDEFEQNDNKTIPPAGFQVIEEFLFPNYTKDFKVDLLKELSILKGNLIRLERIAENNELTDAHIFDAARLEIYRIITLGITGFDSPIAQNSLDESSLALEGIEEYFKVYSNNENVQSIDLILKNIAKAKNYLTKNKNFETFDRGIFITEYANPISISIHDAHVDLKVPFFNESRAVRTTAKTLFENNAFDAEAFSGFPDYKTTAAKIELGKMFFNDAVLSRNNRRSCASCHYADQAFSDGLEKASKLNGKGVIQRNTPTLLNSAYQRTFFYDSRVNYLEDQALAVIANENEMHGKLGDAVLKLKNKKEYVTAFNKAFKNKEINDFTVKNAIASYIRSLGKLDSKFDDYMNGKAKLSAYEKAGFNLFAGKAKCATCHFIPLTNGTVPPNYDKSESEVLGVPNKNKTLDSDIGKFELTKAAIHKFSFKTPTLRNVALTAPYMHNGVYKTLEEVIDFYNDGGGNGLGFNLPNQTLPEDKLNLTAIEKKQLIAYLKTLNNK